MSFNDTILRQYSGLDKIYNIVSTFSQAVSIDDFTDDFITEVWDVLSCGSYGLDVWGKIVNISRYVTSDTSGGYFGFQGASTSAPSATFPHPFNTKPFYSGAPSTTNFRLGDDAYRTLILAKAFTNISIATIPEFNKFLTILFQNRGKAYMVNNRDMTISIVVSFDLFQYESAILQNYEVMPIPSGVLVSVVQDNHDYFGFSSDAEPFDQGVFLS